jgi:hypothetical protein
MILLAQGDFFQPIHHQGRQKIGRDSFVEIAAVMTPNVCVCVCVCVLCVCTVLYFGVCVYVFV